MADEWFQQRLGVLPDIPPEDATKAKATRKALPTTKCRFCGQEILEPYQQGTSERVKTPKGETIVQGKRLKLDPTPDLRGAFFTIGKIAHRRRPEDDHPSLLFYREHRCSGFQEAT